MKPFDLSGFKRFSAAAIFFAAAIFLFFQPVIACSWDYDIWQVRSKNADPLYRYIKNGKAGYIDQTGKIVIQPTLEFYGNYHGEFNDGLLNLLSWEGPYIDRTGKIVITNDYYRTYGFSEGLAIAIKNDGEKPGFIDRTGKFVIKPGVADSFGDFSEGLASAEIKDLKGYINKKGEFVITPKFLRAFDFSDGLAKVIVEGPCAYIGDDPCAPFNAQMVGGKGYVDQETPMCKFAFIDKTGAFISNERFVRADDFSEGLAAVILKGEWNSLGFGAEKNWGFIDTKGNVVIKPQFDDVSSFSDGLAAVKIDKKWGFINKQGEIIIKPQFNIVQNFSDGLAAVGIWNEKQREYREYYYIDKEGKRAFPETFLYASQFFKGLAHVKLKTPESMKEKYNYTYKGTFAYIDTKGRKVFVYERDAD